MKPQKNIVFCYGCRRRKMLFESQAKADNFLRYNSEEIFEENGKAPIRSYYCEICGGYHVTSIPSKEVGENLDERDHQRIESFIVAYKEFTERKNILSQRLVKIRALLYLGEVEEAENLLYICGLDIEKSLSERCGLGKIIKLRCRYEEMLELLASVKNALNLSEEEQDKIISNPNLEGVQYVLSIILTNIKAIRKVESLLIENEDVLNSNDIDKACERLNECRTFLSLIKRFGRKEIKRKYNLIIQEQESQIIIKAIRKVESLLIENENALSSNDIDKACERLNECRTLLSLIKRLGRKEVKLKYNSVIQEQESQIRKINTRFTIDKKTYREIILSLIERIEKINKNFENGDYEECETLLEICYYMLDELQVEDENTAIINEQLNHWEEKIKSIL